MKKVFLIVAVVLLLFSAGMSMSVGIGFLTQLIPPNRPFETMGLVGTIFAIVAGFITLGIFGLGLFIIIRNKFTLISAILSFTTGIINLSCAPTPIFHSWGRAFTGLTIAAGVINIIVGMLFLAHYILSSIKKINGNGLSKNSKKELELLDKIYRQGILTEEEYTQKKWAVLDSAVEDIQPNRSISHINKKPLILSIAAVFVVAVYCSVALPVISSLYKANIYDYVLDTIAAYEKYSAMECLDYLPDSYKDTKSIKITYEKVHYYLFDYRRNESLACYAELAKIQKSDYRWNFERMFENISFFDIYNVRWEGSDKIYVDYGWFSGYVTPYFKYIDNQDSETFDTNLPNKKESGKSYYFYTEFQSDSTIIGFLNQKNSSDKFQAYRISDIRYNPEKDIFSLNVYCYSDNKTYKLQYKYE